MILRRFILHIKEQNWLAVGLDVCVVIVGIFLGMQVTEWNDARKESLRELGYLHSLYDDSIKSIERHEFIKRWEDQRIEGDELVLTVLRGKDLLPEQREPFGNAIYHLVNREELSSTWNTFLELRSSGQVQLIEDTELLLNIRNLEERFNRTSKIIENKIQQNLNLASLISDRYYVRGVKAFGGEHRAILDFNFEELSVDESFTNIVSNIVANNYEITMFRNAYHRKTLSFNDFLIKSICNKYKIDKTVPNEMQVACPE